MNMNCPKFVEAAREKKAARRTKHKAEMARRIKSREDWRQERFVYWHQYDKLLTEYLDSAKAKAQREAP